MTWIIWTLLGTTFSSIERIIDKKLVIGKKQTLDSLIASFYRNFTYFIIINIFGMIGVFGKINIFFSIPIIVWAFFHLFGSLLYDYFLKNSEIVRYNSIICIFPVILILFDKYLFNISYSAMETIGLLLLVLGGFLVSINVKTKENAFSIKQWLLLIITFIISGSQLFLFKYYNSTLDINAISFYTNTWFFVILFFIIAILIQRKQGKLITIAKENKFLLKTFVSKLFDSLSGLFILFALVEGTVSKVYALQSASPLIAFLLVWFLVRIAKVNLDESLEGGNIVAKLFGVLILSVGSYLIIAV
jgi:uncharacterized membrane protein